MITELEFYIDYLIWGDNVVINELEKLTDEEFHQSFGSIAGSIASKTGHLVGIYEFFVSAIDGTPYDHFPNFNELTRDELLNKWKELLYSLKLKVKNRRNEFFEVPLAQGNFVNIELTYIDALFHSIHHRGQIISFLRILGKDQNDIHPKDVNVDFFNYIFKKKKSLILNVDSGNN